MRKISPPTGIRFPDRPASSQLHRLRYSEDVMKVKFLEPKVHISFTSDQVIQLGCAVLHSIRLNLALISVWYKMFCRIAFLVCASYCCGNPFFNEGGWRNICDMLLCLTGSALHLVICISDLKQGKINLIPRFNLEWFTFCS